MHKGTRHETATAARSRKFGHANQMAHEARGKRQRETMQSFMASSKAERKRQAGMAMRKTPKTTKKDDSGMNAGTMGGSNAMRGGTRGSKLAAAFFGR